MVPLGVMTKQHLCCDCVVLAVVGQLHCLLVTSGFVSAKIKEPDSWSCFTTAKWWLRSSILSDLWSGAALGGSSHHYSLRPAMDPRPAVTSGCSAGLAAEVWQVLRFPCNCLLMTCTAARPGGNMLNNRTWQAKRPKTFSPLSILFLMISLSETRFALSKLFYMW